MPLFTHAGLTPRVDPTARVAPTASIVGDVEIGAGSSIGFGAVIVAESGPVRIGASCVVMENAVIRGTRKNSTVIGDMVLVGPCASLVGCTLEDEVFVATGAAVFNGAHLGRRSEIRVHGIVHLRTRLAPDTVVPLGWIAVGDPAIIRPPKDHDEIWKIQRELDFPGYVFGVPRPPAGRSIMPDVMPRYAAALIRGHAGDEPA